MGCSCGSGGCGSKVSGCQSNGGCSSGGCNRLNVFDWLSDISHSAERDSFNIIEVSFKNGSRKEFYRNPYNINCVIGDFVTVEAQGGFDVGSVSLCGELVRLQMRKKKVKEDSERILKIMRLSTERDLEKLEESRAKEKEGMIRARVLARELKLNMKIGDVEYQANGRKATFYYTADNRVDFRELIKIFAGEFRVKIEMKQIGSRQEAGKIGGIGTCGRELCCSSWLTNFKSVSTSAARYQQLAINQAKLSGQCGRLKCCLNFELDTYIDALSDFPKGADYLKGDREKARLVKKDIFNRKMTYMLMDSRRYVVLDVDRVKEVQSLNAKGKFPVEFGAGYIPKERQKSSQEPEIEYVDTVGQTSLKSLERTSKRSKQKKRRNQKGKKPNNNQPNGQGPKNQGKGSSGNKKRRRPNKNRGKKKGPNTGPKPSGEKDKA